MLTVDQVKQYLGIPGTQDDAFIELIITDGYDYLRDAVDDFDTLYNSEGSFKRKADAWVLNFYTADAYDQREGAYDGQRVDMNRPSRALLTQLQLYRKG